MHKPVIILLVGCLWACQSPSGQKTTEDTTAAADITPVDTAERPGNTAVAQDPAEQEIMAQDSVFEDGSVPTSWSNAGFDDPAGFKRFVARFKGWVKEDNVDSIVAYIDFPLKKYKTAAVFKEKYGEIFDDSLKAVVTRQRLDRIFRNADGAMIGDGQVWFGSTEKGYRVIGVNK
jgi:hypothetical protein